MADLLEMLKRLWGRIRRPKPEAAPFPEIFEQFQTLLQDHQQVMELIADLGEKSGGEYIFDRKYLVDFTNTLHTLLLRMVNSLNLMADKRYMDLYTSLDRIFQPMEAELRGRLLLSEEMPLVIGLSALPLDHPELTGGKANNLGRISQSLKLPVPNGFVITTRAYRKFLEVNRLEERIHARLEAWTAGELDTEQTSRQIQYSILAGLPPKEVAAEIRRQAARDEMYWAVRSSAYGEDGELTFAGLHETRLQVPSRKILSAYKEVLASLYSSQALIYRQRMGLLGEEAAMAVLCQETIASRTAGVIHTLDLSAPEANCLVIYASWGWGRTVVEGRAQVDRLVVEKDPPFRVSAAEIARKEIMVRPKPGGGEEEIAVPPEQQILPSLADEDVSTLVKWALSLERYFKRPQEIEWAQDDAGALWILQSRSMNIPRMTMALHGNIAEITSRYPVLIKDVGTVAHAGVGSGPVCRVDSDAKLELFPEGGVLVIKYTAPWLTPIVPKASAIVSERGSAAGHLATIAREFRVPTLVGVEGAYDRLPEGDEVTVDTKQRVIYAGRIKELLQYELVQAPAFEETQEFRQLRRLLKRIAPLHLIDPEASNFTPQGCESVHDVIRFIHEKAVNELMDLPRFLKRFKGVQIYTLSSDVPIGLKILDLEGGIDPQVQGNRVTAEHIRSLPLKALWEGVSAPGVWSTEPIPVDFKGMMSSLTKTWAESPGTMGYTGFNLAVVSRVYMNLHLRLGYHLNLVDARMHPEPQHNHIYFRFVGGVTDMTRRSRRAQLLAHILSKFHFKVDVKGDLVVARVLHLSQEEMHLRLEVLGQLIGFTRQLDIQLKSDADIPQFMESFFQQHSPDRETPSA
ncbi:MAG: PEP/pyruvate-binding domain-containing protein [Deltaproteobacteria bacterium]|nr:PEP/pyruvate-binding domain-containing protein [Deltaproteobacteria bacterium]